MLVVDPRTGAMYRLEPKSLDATLTPLKALMPLEQSGSHVVSLTDLPPALLEQSRLIAIHRSSRSTRSGRRSASPARVTRQ
jgi:hypothetical protein